MQMKGTSGSVFAYNSTWHAGRVIFQKEGIYGLYKGNVPNLVKVIGSHYEISLNRVLLRNDESEF